MADAAPGDAAAKKAAPRDAAPKKATPKGAAAKEAEPREAEPKDDAAPEDAGAEDEMKRKFRAALDRKNSQLAEHNARQGGKGGGKVQGAHGPAQSKRAFRRKSGG
jgi:Family of unknown function (DUF5302)